MIFTLLLALPAFIVIWFVVTYIEHLWKLRNYPRGPFPMPMVGNLMLLSKKPWVDLANFSKTYGDIFSMSFGMKRVVVVNSYELYREALVTRGTDFAGRSTTSIPMRIQSKGFKGVASGDYTQTWIFVRKLACKSMHLFGNGLQKVEEIINDEIDNISTILTKENGNSVSVKTFFGNIIVNVICQYCYNKKYNVDDPELQDILNYINMTFAGLGPGEPLAVLPWLRFFPDSKKMKITKEGIRLRDEYTQRQFDEHRQTLDPNNIRDITDNLLHLSQSEEIWKEHGFTKVGEDDLQMIVNSLFMAGVETTLSTIRWFFLYLFNYPQYQQMLYEEIKSKIGLKRPVNYKDVEFLPLVNAAILETMRLSSVAPLGVPHNTTTETSLGGESIPKNTMVVFNFYNIHHNESFWKNPDEFKPERWLNEDGTLRPEKEFDFIAFSTGTRSCIGEKMARIELFLMVTRILAKFEVKPDPDKPLPNLEGNGGMTYAPANDYKAVFIIRS